MFYTAVKQYCVVFDLVHCSQVVLGTCTVVFHCVVLCCAVLCNIMYCIVYCVLII